VELAKAYSTPKSYSYINGMLDAISRYLVDIGKMLKPVGELPERKQQAADSTTPKE